MYESGRHCGDSNLRARGTMYEQHYWMRRPQIRKHIVTVLYNATQRISVSFLSRTTRRKLIARTAARCSQSVQLDCKSSRPGIRSIKMIWLTIMRSSLSVTKSSCPKGLFKTCPRLVRKLFISRPCSSVRTRDHASGRTPLGIQIWFFFSMNADLEWFPSFVLRILYTSSARSGLDTMQMSSKNANRRSAGSNCRCTVCSAWCSPNEKINDIRTFHLPPVRSDVYLHWSLSTSKSTVCHKTSKRKGASDPHQTLCASFPTWLYERPSRTFLYRLSAWRPLQNCAQSRLWGHVSRTHSLHALRERTGRIKIVVSIAGPMFSSPIAWECRQRRFPALHRLVSGEPSTEPFWWCQRHNQKSLHEQESHILGKANVCRAEDNGQYFRMLARRWMSSTALRRRRRRHTVAEARIKRK